MRRKLAAAVAAALAAGALAVVASTGTTPAAAAAAEPYSWGNVEIDGGGFVPGIVFNHTEKNLDLRPHRHRRRVPLEPGHRPAGSRCSTGSAGTTGATTAWSASPPTRSTRTGCTPPSACTPTAGTRTTARSCARPTAAPPGRSPSCRSRSAATCPAAAWASGSPSTPTATRVLYFGAEGGNGLWRSTDSGVTWAQGHRFPNAGNYVQDPADPNGYLSQNQGVIWVTLRQTQRHRGTATRTSTSAWPTRRTPSTAPPTAAPPGRGSPASPPATSPTRAWSTRRPLLYIATSDTGGPYDGGKGDVWRFDAATGAWTRISPMPSTSADAYFGYCGLTIDRQNPDTIMVATQISWWPDAIFFRSTDGGATWTRIWDFTSYPNRVLRYTMDISAAPWLTFGQQPAAAGGHAEARLDDRVGGDRPVRLQPDAVRHRRHHLRHHQPHRVGHRRHRSPSGRWRQGSRRPPSSTWSARRPVRRWSARSATSAASGTPTSTPCRPMMFTRHAVHLSTTTPGLRRAEPGGVGPGGQLRRRRAARRQHVAFSTDGGANWFQGRSRPGSPAAARWRRPPTAAGSSGRRRRRRRVYSSATGSSWTPAAGHPGGRDGRVRPGQPQDVLRVLRRHVLRQHRRRGHVHRDRGDRAADPARQFKAVPGRRGRHLAGRRRPGLWHSTDSGATFTTAVHGDQRRSTSASARRHRARPTRRCSSSARSTGSPGVFRSDDAGATWVRINDDAHQYGNMGEALTGDPRVYGRVYLGTNGRGILVADRRAARRARRPRHRPRRRPPPRPTASPTASAHSVADAPQPGRLRGDLPGDRLVAGGFQAEVTVRNTGTAADHRLDRRLDLRRRPDHRPALGRHAHPDRRRGDRPQRRLERRAGARRHHRFGFLASWTGTNPVPPVTCT